ncbi:MAG: KTSC domain-containing protein [Salibacteraceae bacterium]|jgi:DnaJ-class molecular chaperone|nr:KTSC domain-containing protein [Salibacteraceae bacterium]MDP4685291.1 KTSC domain-containing protein [Salibacteraceae bacterium]MDP4763441.1 KTSC domain-containing protein [Salibacteraceae bacterium]MDP4844769.1 KTSC domain-containing protein [Salibacteraceae bacterium]MDP4934589.1 KTSC domain-containing protein [Salibacteraceae bacterium]
MKRINEYKKLFSVEGEITLDTLKKTYRNLVKEWHPDKFQAGDEKALEAEEMSRKIIDGYHFLVSIAPETREAQAAEYEAMINEFGIADYKHKGLLLEITFTNGDTYEYFGVPKNVFLKFNSSDKQVRFAKRSIYTSFVYRKAKNAVEA